MWDEVRSPKIDQEQNPGRPWKQNVLALTKVDKLQPLRDLLEALLHVSGCNINDHKDDMNAIDDQ